MIRVLFFGPVADRVQTREMQFDFTPGMTLHDIIHKVGMQHPGALSIVSFIAVNQVQVRDKQVVLHDNDEIALMAKFSGG
ncbi:MAG: molybdopterin synthase sulfur carrier subunit [Gallionellaceae bacterium]|nr:MAG: molybdopterin synthase sulfur carrier subunit [Gallionellaceae bacterium]